jgi:hypothetical protein
LLAAIDAGAAGKAHYPGTPPSILGDGVERLRNGTQFVGGHLEVADVRLARPPHLWQFADQIPLDCCYCLGNVIHPTLDSRRLATVLEAYGGRLAIEATVEPPVTEGG